MTTPAAGGFAPGETVALRPGLRLPDWSRLTDPASRAALAAAMALAGRRERWAGLEAGEDAVRRAVLRHFAAHGTGPGLREVAAAAALDEAGTLGLLRGLRRRDLLVLDPAEAAVSACYPFCAAPTPQRLRLGGPPGGVVHALCAVDALGAGGMLGRDAVVEARCAHCGAAVVVRTCDAGQGLASVEPGGALVWYGLRYAGDCAATSGCALKPFLCSPAHLEGWRDAADPGGPGVALTIAQAFQIGLALFGPMLRPGG